MATAFSTSTPGTSGPRVQLEPDTVNEMGYLRQSGRSSACNENTRKLPKMPLTYYAGCGITS